MLKITPTRGYYTGDRLDRIETLPVYQFMPYESYVRISVSGEYRCVLLHLGYSTKKLPGGFDLCYGMHATGKIIEYQPFEAFSDVRSEEIEQFRIRARRRQKPETILIWAL